MNFRKIIITIQVLVFRLKTSKHTQKFVQKKITKKHV